jgi:hypothetical protein
MKRSSAIAILIVSLLIIDSCTQKTTSIPSPSFFNFLNTYQADSLQTLLADNFKIKRTFAIEKTDRIHFFEYHIPVSSNINSKFKVLKFEISGKSEKYLIEEESDFIKLLDIDHPRWIITLIKDSSNKIETAIFDTTDTFRKYLNQSEAKGRGFFKWLEHSFPVETTDSLYATRGLMRKRLIEYLGQETH